MNIAGIVLEYNTTASMYILTLLTCIFAQISPQNTATTISRPTLLTSLSLLPSSTPSTTEISRPTHVQTTVKTVTHTITVTHTVTQKVVLPVLITVTQIVTVTLTVTPLPLALPVESGQESNLPSTNQILTVSGIAITCTAFLFGVMLYSFLKARKSKPIASSPKQVVYDARPKLHLDTTVAYNWPTHTRDLSV